MWLMRAPAACLCGSPALAFEPQPSSWVTVVPCLPTPGPPGRAFSQTEIGGLQMLIQNQ